MTIRRLPEALINRIAAGEVVERPASAVKELVENALDAGADRIDVTLRDGGQSFISVTDNGRGMTADELCLAVERHATSKLPTDDLVTIATLGFRGEALPSIGAVSRLSLTSRAREAGDDAWCIDVVGGDVSAPKPAALRGGTQVEVRDLFFATPARLKFLKTPPTEQRHAVDVIQRLAMAHPHVAFSLQDEKGEKVKLAVATGDLLDAPLDRLRAVLGTSFGENAVPVSAERRGIVLSGYAGLPTYNRANGLQQYLFVNGRPVRDRLLAGAVRGAYQDFLARDRHPVLALFLEVPLELVDVNVHPAKAEVRFREPGVVRGLIVSALRHALDAAGHRASTTVAAAALGAIRAPVSHWPGSGGGGARVPTGAAEAAAVYMAPPEVAGPLPGLDARPMAQVPTADASPEDSAYPLGAARAQLHGTYIVSQTADGLVIVDQHAAHERLVLEQMLGALANGGVKRQTLLIPEVVELEAAAVARLLERSGELAELGLIVDAFGQGAVVVREVPAILGQADVARLVRDMADELAGLGTALSLKERLTEVCGTMACHGSVRAGRSLNAEEMNELLRRMEATPHAGQCNHGRPTYVELRLKDIERLFGRR